jgi:uracil-DNA glycosylase family 4
MCSPRSETDANRKPTRSEIRNCSSFLARQIDIIEPHLVATLGAVALDALRNIEDHFLKLGEHAGTLHNWNGIRLVPLYHPSPQVIASQRGIERQLGHFQMLKTAILTG